MTSDPESAPAWRWVLVLLLWLAIGSGFLAAGIDPILKGDLGDSDAYLQLVKASRIVETRDWYDNVIPRSNWPRGEVTAWSRALDAALLSGAALLTPVQGFHDALFWFGAVFSPLCFLLAAFMAGWMAKPLLGPAGRLGAALLLLIQPGLQNYAAFSPNHHSLLFLAFIATIGFLLRTLATPAAIWPPALAGLAMALGLWTSVEFLVPLAVVLLTLGLLWLRHGEIWVQANRRFTGSLLASLVILQPVERSPFHDMLTAEFDRMSIVHALLALLLFVFWILVPMVARAGGIRMRLATGLAGTALAAATLYVVFPKFFAGPLVDVDPALIPFLVTNNADWQPILPDSLKGIGNFLFYLGMPSICLFWIAWRGYAARKDASAALWLLLLLLMLAYLAMATRSIRFSGYPEILALIPLADLIGWVHTALNRRKSTAATLGRSLAVAALIIAIPAAGAYLLSLSVSRNAMAENTRCRIADIAPVLSDPAGLGSRQQFILAEIHSGSELLYRTRHAVLATPMFRNSGILDAYRILSAQRDEDARVIVAARHVDLILLCPRQSERNSFGSGGHEDTLYNRLLQGRLPGWVEPVPLPAAAASFRLFAVRP